MTSTPIQDFHEGFDAPFNDFLTASLLATGPFPFPIEINGVGYVMDLTQWRHGTLPQFRQQSDTSREPGEQSLSIEGVWKRTGSSHIRGAGQEFYDDDSSDRTRFYRSAGIDAWQARHIKLLADTDLTFESAATNLHCMKFDDLFLFADDTVLYASDDPRSDTGGWDNQDLYSGGPTHPILALTTNGTTVYAACGVGGGVRSVVPGDPGGALMVSGGTFPATFILYANGWLVGTADNVVQSIASDGSLTPVFTHRNPGFDFVTGASAPNAIYLGGNAGDRAEFYRTTVNQEGSALSIPIFAGELPAGETVYSMSYYNQLMLIGTSRGLRVATMDNEGGLSIGAVIEDVSGQGVRAFDARGQYAWFGWVNPADNNRRGLARADLAHNTEAGVPAWSGDLASDETTGRTTSVATWVESDREYRLFCVSGSGLWAETDELRQEGTIEIGWLAMGSPERKSLQSMSVSHEQLHGAILMRVENEQGQSVEAPSEAQATYTSGEMTRPIVGELLSLDLTLTRDEADPTRGPVVRRWTMRVVPAPASVDEILVPILLADVVKDSGTDVEHNYDPFGVLFRLKTLENDRTVVTYREGQASYLVTVRAVGMEGAKDWTSNRRFLNGVLMVRLITCEGIPPQLPGGEF